jgi:hypothetical protein
MSARSRIDPTAVHYLMGICKESKARVERRYRPRAVPTPSWLSKQEDWDIRVNFHDDIFHFELRPIVTRVSKFVGLLIPEFITTINLGAETFIALWNPVSNNDNIGSPYITRKSVSASPDKLISLKEIIIVGNLRSEDSVDT